MQISVTPTSNNFKFNEIEGAEVTCWVRDYDPISAHSKAIFYIKKYDWNIEKILDSPTVVTKSHFEGKDIGLEKYNVAIKEGLSFAYVGWLRNRKEKIISTYNLKSSHNFDLQSYLSEQKKLRNKGRCLHFKKDDRCKEIINAHSIQKNGVLSEISSKGKVYSLSRNINDLKNNNGSLIFEKHGINKVSTFKGFCKYHDNKLFEPIDNHLLKPTKQQVFLYAYRSLCKELFLKENSLNLLLKQYEDTKEHIAYKDMFSTLVNGTRHGYENLLKHKKTYDKALNKESFNEIKYCAFFSLGSPFMAYSGVLYPEYDFLGNLIQDLSDDKNNLDMIAHCSAPTADGWSHIFAWHDSSSRTSVHFMNTLANKMHNNEEVGDLLFRFVILNCENIAFSPRLR